MPKKLFIPFFSSLSLFFSSLLPFSSSLLLLLSSLLFFSFLLTSCASLPGIITLTPSAAPEFPTEPRYLLTPDSVTLTIPPSATLPAASETPAPSPAPTLTAETSPAAILSSYTLDALMDYDAKTLQVTQEIIYTHNAETVETLVLAIRPNEMPNVFSLQSVSLDGAPLTTYELDGPKLTIRLPAPLENGQSLALGLEYSLTLPEMQQENPNLVRPQIFGFSQRQVNLTDWFPLLVPYLPGQGWLLHDPWFYGEHLVYPLANFDVTLRFSDPAAAPTVIAASGDGQPIEAGFRYRLARGRTFALSMGKTLQVESAQSGQVLISSYFYPGSEAAAHAALEATAKALETYSALFGAYPHATLAVVQGDFNDGMEFDGLYYLSDAFYNLYDGTERNYLVMVAAHETCHQWWFGRVANDQFAEPWLDESLATYCERLFYEKNYPADVDWWQSYRIDFYEPKGFIDGDLRSYSGFTPYTDATYRRGARFLQELRQTMGDDAFFAFLKDYSQTMNGKIASAADFFRLLKAHTSADLNALLAEYFSAP
ncbi:MAG: M1 family metallopeptidase [Anaerolineales bacterium]